MGQYRQCIDPRDKIYGLLGLIAPSTAKAVKLDYGIAIPEVYSSAFLAYVSVTKRFDILSQCRLDQRFRDGPSWASDLALETHNGAVDIVLPLGRYPSGNSSALFQYLAPDIIHVTGLAVSPVTLFLNVIRVVPGAV